MSAQLPGWPHRASPFHEGERQVQQQAGVADKMEAIGRRVIRSFMPEEHRELFGKLPLLMLGALDAAGWPWASAVTGAPGFVSTPDERTLRVRALPRHGDPVASALRAGAAVGILGLEAATRRRNRVNGVLGAVDEDGFTVRVRQSFGNCPQYIWARAPLPAAPAPEAAGEARALGPALDDEARALICAADTFFVASASAGCAAAARDGVELLPSDGVDVSHRGGAPGFVEVRGGLEGLELRWPDYRGNYLFNTLGNLASYPRVGLLFLDLLHGAALAVSGLAHVSWDAPELAAHEGAQRVVTVRVRSGRWVPKVIPWRWTEAVAAPQLSSVRAQSVRPAAK